MRNRLRLSSVTVHDYRTQIYPKPGGHASLSCMLESLGPLQSQPAQPKPSWLLMASLKCTGYVVCRCGSLSRSCPGIESPCCAAFAVASLAEAELRLKEFGIEYHKFLVPGTNASQIFLYDPEGEMLL